MGAFGVGTFDNDDALDFVDELVESGDASILAAALDEALRADYLEMPEASAALVASEVLAAKNLRPADDLPDELQTWVASAQLSLDEQILTRAQKAVARISTDSELSEEWGASELAEQWYAYLVDLRKRLDAG